MLWTFTILICLVCNNILLSFYSFPDSWHCWSACLEGKMAWVAWEENYSEWARNLHTQLFRHFTSLFVCCPKHNPLFLWWKKHLVLESNIYYHLLYLLLDQFYSRIVVSWMEICLLLFSCLTLVYFRYTTSPHLFNGDAEVAFARVRDKVSSFSLIIVLHEVKLNILQVPLTVHPKHI